MFQVIENKLLVFGNELKHDFYPKKLINVTQEYISHVAASDLSEHLKMNWNFSKIHLWKHVLQNIRNKGATRNYSTKLNEKMHTRIDLMERMSQFR
ncbi:hypothetical protein J3R83DRAFT_3386 [Lanmaoa asiatica]|nr:hypothetical protein J3R83DRAFT_3386 [Lanmaoa asiatica]